jgi:formylglycine-generating enzyme required for sulfatase activity
VAYAVSTNAGNDDGWVSEWWERFWQTCELSERRLQPPIDWCIVPGGHFDIVHGRHYDERPNQTVAVLSFELAKTPVTRAQYLAFDPERVGNSSDETPMTGLSWWEAWLFCRWVGGRLPSEDEWEYACRGGGSHSGRPDGADLQQYLEQNGDELMRPVASRPANSFGLHDMQELVWEWCLDGSLDFDSGVQGGELARGDHLAAFRVLRGLAWHIVRGWARAKLRASKKPSFRIDYVGFRPAR